MLTLLQLIIVLIVLGLVWWLIVTYLPVPQPMKNIIVALIVLAVCLYLLAFAGIVHLPLR